MERVSYQHLFVLLARVLLAGTFVLAALPKIKDPVTFASSVGAYRIVGSELSTWIALMLPWLELIIGIGILIPNLRLASNILIASLLLIFIALHISAWSRGLALDCGCFGAGSAGETTTNYPWWITRNTLLFIASLAVFFEDLKRMKNCN